MIGKYLIEQNKKVAILDIDERFKQLKGFRKFDINKPEFLKEQFSIILCDPPFFNVSLSQLFNSIRIISNYNFNQKLLLSYLKRREDSIMGTFSKFNLIPTGYLPKYVTV